MRCGKQIENSVGGSGFHVADEYLRGSRGAMTAASSGAKQQGDSAKYRLQDVKQACATELRWEGKEGT